MVDRRRRRRWLIGEEKAKEVVDMKIWRRLLIGEEEVKQVVDRRR